MDNKGFTLVELLAIIVVLAIILAVAVPGITGIIRNSTIEAFRSDAINASGTNTGQPNHYSGYVFTNGQMIAGNTSMPTPAGGNETGHTGNGYARIVFIS